MGCHRTGLRGLTWGVEGPGMRGLLLWGLSEGPGMGGKNAGPGLWVPRSKPGVLHTGDVTTLCLHVART